MRIMLCSSAGHTTPPVAYGSEVTTWYLAEELSKLGHTVCLIAAEGSRVPPGGDLYTMPLDAVNPHLTERWRAMEFISVMFGCDIVHDCSCGHIFADISHNIGHGYHLATLNGISFLTPERKHNICVLSEAARQAALNGTPAWGEDYLEFRTDPGRLPSCEVVNYGCLTGESMLWTESGLMPISAFVGERTNLRVWGIHRGRPVLTDVLGHFVYELAPLDSLLRIVTETGKQLVVTRNNPFLTPDGWRIANELTAGSKIATMNEHSTLGANNEKMDRRREGVVIFPLSSRHMEQDDPLLPSVEAQHPTHSPSIGSKEANEAKREENMEPMVSEIGSFARATIRNLYESRTACGVPKSDLAGDQGTGHQDRSSRIEGKVPSYRRATPNGPGSHNRGVVIYRGHRGWGGDNLDSQKQPCDWCHSGAGPLDFKYLRGTNGVVGRQIEIFGRFAEQRQQEWLPWYSHRREDHGVSCIPGCSGSSALPYHQENSRRSAATLLEGASDASHGWIQPRGHEATEKNVCIQYEEIRFIETVSVPAGGGKVFDIKTKTANFIANGIVSHNTATDFYTPGGPVEDFVLYTGRPHVSKGVHVILRLARLVPDQEFVLAWRADDLDHVKYEEVYLEAAKIVPNVRIVQLPVEGHHEAKRDLYQRAKVFLQPSQYVEAFGLTAIEALACGTPIILANKGSAPEIIRQGVTGFLCESIEDYQQAIRDAGTLSRKACREDAVARFDKRVMAERYLALYERVLRGEQW